MSPPPAEAARSRPIRVKVMSKTPPRVWRHQLPTGNPVWGNCLFLFDRDERNYDWLVVYDDLPARSGERFTLRQEVLGGAPQHTLLVTTEPSSIKIYGSAYTAQFGCVLTSQDAWALPHPDRIFSQPALHWFYGVGREYERPFDEIAAAAPPAKTAELSMVFSDKRQRHTLHSRRFRFMQGLREALPEMEVYGRGVRPLDDKAEAVDAFRYHIAIENYLGPHHWTEKLADPFLGYALPFYAGCPNAAEYFPPQSFIPIDMADLQGAVRIIRAAIRDGEYERRLPHIIEARRRVVEEYNLFAVLSREIAARHQPGAGAAGSVLLSRHLMRRKFPLRGGLRYMFEKARGRVIHATLRGR